MQHLFQAIVETLREPLLILDGSHNVLLANRAFYRKFEASEPDVIGQPFSSISQGNWAIPELRQLLTEIIWRDSRIEDFEVAHVFPRIGYRVMLLNAHQVATDEGRYILIAFEDVTEKRLAEDRTRRIADRLRRSNTELQEFARVASHDLQEPLRKIRAFGDRLKESATDLLPPEPRGYLDRMINASGRMQNLINDLLQLSRAELQPYSFAPVNLQSIVEEVVGDFETHLEESGARISIPRTLPTIEADAVQIRQLAQNLIGNALKYRSLDRPPSIDIQAELSGGPPSEDTFYDLRFSDNGIGFDEKYRDFIFGAFKRLHGRSEYEGTGMGLAICRKIAERHGGSIGAQSSPGAGSTFIVRIPVRQPRGAEDFV